MAGRGSYEREPIDAILDEGLSDTSASSRRPASRS